MVVMGWGVEVDTNGQLALLFIGSVFLQNTFVTGQGVTNSGDLNSQQMLVDNSYRVVGGGNPLYFTGLFQINRAYTITLIASAGSTFDKAQNADGKLVRENLPYYIETVTSGGTSLTIFCSNAGRFPTYPDGVTKQFPTGF